MKTIFKTLIAVAVISATGCAATPTNINAAKETPASRIVAYNAPAAGTGRLILVRDEGYTAGKCDIIAAVNGRKAATIENGEKAILYVPKGDARITAQIDCPLGGSSAKDSLIVGVLPEIPTYIRVDLSQIESGSLKLTETTADNPSFVCPDVTKRLNFTTKADFIMGMRLYNEVAASTREVARKLSVQFGKEEYNACLATQERQIKAFMNPVFAKMKAQAQSPEEKAALIDVYSKFLTVIDAGMSINEIQQMSAAFDAAVNKYELY